MPIDVTRVLRTRELRYPANWLTLVRLLLLPPTIAYLRRPDGRLPALLCMGTALLTDAVDGPLARYREEVSPLGKVLDPIADKLVLNITMLTLVRTRAFPRWFVVLLLIRDIGILLAGLLIYRRRAQVATAKPAGKATTVVLTLAVLLYTADGPRSGRPVLYLALVPFALSFWQYGKLFIKLMRRR